jgi:4-hydroxy-2-oxoheptanedioate aldolase
MEMGIPGEFMHERVQDAYKTMIAACKAHGKVPGMGGIYAPDQMKTYIDLGARMILSGSDFAFMMKGAREQAAAVRALG